MDSLLCDSFPNERILQVLAFQELPKATEVKALFRSAKALFGLKNYTDASHNVKLALAIDAENAEAKKLQAEIQLKVAEEKKREQKTYSKMFS